VGKPFIPLSAYLATFADGQLTEAIRNLASDPSTDMKIKKKLLSVLASWNDQFKSDPSMSIVVNLYRQCRPADARRRANVDQDVSQARDDEYDRKREEKIAKEEAKRRQKLEKEAQRARLRQEEESKRKRVKDKSRKPFNFEEVHFRQHVLRSCLCLSRRNPKS